MKDLKADNMQKELNAKNQHKFIYKLKSFLKMYKEDEKENTEVNEQDLEKLEPLKHELHVETSRVVESAQKDNDNSKKKEDK